MDKVFIIAEAGVNHNGDLDIAKKLIDVAVDAGADAVKFQTFITEDIVSPDAPKAEYQKVTTTTAESQFDMIKKLELSREDHEHLLSYCEDKPIEFLSSPFDEKSVSLLVELGLKKIKVPSGEITNPRLLQKVGSANLPIILSTGMSTLDDIDAALNLLTQSGAKLKNITLMQCNTEYPTPFCDANLRVMKTMRDRFNTAVGFSDHTPGIEISIAAVAMGASIIEKHFTLDKDMDGPDHQASLDPQELKQLIISIRNVEEGLGNSLKEPTASEIPNMAIARKSLVAKMPINKEDVFTNENIAFKRPGTGISPMNINQLLGKVAERDFAEDELIEHSELDSSS
ncbi:MAG: N-acetylneuraminate synthase [Candidatus Lindowbacteria bacterium]|nr:N-acetylneuraminate synthase [Candidatus Lindowbacteria bacterium]